jgi:peptide/nickel transport system permease protein
MTNARSRATAGRLPAVPTLGDAEVVAARGRRPPRGFFAASFRRFLRDRLSVAALVVFLVIVLVTLLAPLIAEYLLGTTPEDLLRTPEGRIATLQPPGPGYPLGTDELGRDTLTRLLYAGRVSLTVGFLVAAIALAIGTPLGLIAATTAAGRRRRERRRPGGRQRAAAVHHDRAVGAVPAVAGLVALLFGLFSWPSTTRQVRGLVLSLRNRDYVDAARVLGASDARILASTSAERALDRDRDRRLRRRSAILGESVLSFLGFGVRSRSRAGATC